MARKLTVGIDVGGTKIQAGLVSGSGKILKRLKIATETKRGSAAVLANILRAAEAVWAPGVRAAGIGLAGLVDHKKRDFVQGPNFPASFKNVPLGRLFEKKFKVPVRVDNDAHCFTLAEAKFGSAKGRGSVVGLTLGTGIGGGLVIDGRLFRGRNNAAGEIGHMTIADGREPSCGCGALGHFEALASGSAMTKLYALQTGRALDSLAVEKLALSGDAAAAKVFEIMSHALAVGLANIIQVLNPDIIVLGGGLIRVRTLLKPALSLVKKLVVFPELRSTPVVVSKLSDDAGVLGAALLTAEKIT